MEREKGEGRKRGDGRTRRRETALTRRRGAKPSERLDESGRGN